MSKTVISIENIGKLYRLGEIGTGTLSHDLNRWWARVRGREDPYKKIGQENDRTRKSDADYIWALDNINLDIHEGDVVGIIGRNGAGKSTLLKLISRITAPTTGCIRIRGRVGSLLEVGTGMHSQMTARENIFLNGAILGMKRHEIVKKFDDIVDFSGCSLYIDTPIKRFSTGMRVRLGFSVAAFLDPEILIVDEVLAVGDAEFQKRALGKIGDITHGTGRTVLFVSHNLAAVRSICEKGVLLDNGRITTEGNINHVIEAYKEINNQYTGQVVDREKLRGSKIDGFRLTDLVLEGSNSSGQIVSGEDLYITLYYEASRRFPSPSFVVQIKDETDQEIIRLSNMPISGFQLGNLYSTGAVKLHISELPLVKGQYYIDIGFTQEKVEWHFKLENVVNLYVEGRDVYNSGMELDRSRGLVWVKHKWQHQDTGQHASN